MTMTNSPRPPGLRDTVNHKTRGPFLAALQIQKLVVPKPVRLTAAGVVDQECRLAGGNVQHPDLGCLFVLLKRIGRHLEPAEWSCQFSSNLYSSVIFYIRSDRDC